MSKIFNPLAKNEGQTETAAPTLNLDRLMRKPAEKQAKEAPALRRNQMDDTSKCPVDGAPMRRGNAGVKGKHDIPVYICTTHRVCLPVPNEELPHV